MGGGIGVAVMLLGNFSMTTWKAGGSSVPYTLATLGEGSTIHFISAVLIAGSGSSMLGWLQRALHARHPG